MQWTVAFVASNDEWQTLSMERTSGSLSTGSEGIRWYEASLLHRRRSKDYLFETTVSRWLWYEFKREDDISARVQVTKCGEKIVSKAYSSGIQFGSSSSDVGVPLDAIPYVDKKWTKLLAELARLWRRTGGPDATFSFPSSSTFRTYSRGKQ